MVADLAADRWRGGAGVIAITHGRSLSRRIVTPRRVSIIRPSRRMARYRCTDPGYRTGGHAENRALRSRDLQQTGRNDHAGTQSQRRNEEQDRRWPSSFRRWRSRQILAAAGMASGATARTASAIPSDGVRPPGGEITEIEPPIAPPQCHHRTRGVATATGARDGDRRPARRPGLPRRHRPPRRPVPARSRLAYRPYRRSGWRTLCQQPVATLPDRPARSGHAAGRPNGHGTAGPTTVTVGQAGGKSNVLVDQNGCALYLNINDTNTTSACDCDL